MKTNNAKWMRWMRRASSLILIFAMTFGLAGQASARILFEDDIFLNVQSEGIILDSNNNVATGGDITLQFGNTGATDGTMKYNTTTNALTIDTAGNAIDFSNDSLTTTGAVNFSGASQMRIRETADVVDGTTACNNVGEIAMDTGEQAIYICVNATTDDWTAMPSDAADYLLSGASDNYTAGTLTLDAGTTLDVNGAADFSGATSMIIPTAATDPVICSVGQLYFNTANGELMLCTASNTWTNAGPQDFEDVYAYDADNTLTASGTFDIDATGAVGIDSDASVTIGGAGIGITSDGGALALTGDGTNDIDISNAGAAIDIDSATLTIDTTGAFSIDGAAASNVTVAGANLTLSTATSGDLYMTSAGELYFTDSRDSLTFTQVSAGMGDDLLNAGGEIYNATGTIGATIGIGETSTSLIHAINAVGTYATTIGAGANDDIDDVYNNGAAGTYIANVDASPTGYNVTSTDGDGFIVQDTGSTFANFNVDGSGNPLIDFDPYDFTLDATNIFSIQGVGDSDITTTVGDLILTAGDDMIFDDAQLVGIVQLTDTATDWAAILPSDGIIDNINAFTSTANGEGASLVGVEDVGGYFTGTDVEAVLQELGADVAIEVEDLTFYPEWPDAAVWADGTDNRGTLTSEYDSAQDTNYYNWTTTRATQQDINVQFMFTLPPDYSAIGANGLQFEYRTGAGGTGSNAVQLYMYERTGAGATTACGNTALLSNGTGAGGAFATGQITKATIDGTCTLSAGDVILIEAKFFDDTGAADFADVGYVTLDYTR